MKDFRYTRSESGITKIRYDGQGDYCWEPMSWGSVSEYVRWCIETIDDPNLNKWSTPELRSQTLAMLEQMLDKLES